MFPISGSSMVPYMKQLNQQSELFNMLIATYVIRWVKGLLNQHQQLMHKQDITIYPRSLQFNTEHL